MRNELIRSILDEKLITIIRGVSADVLTDTVAAMHRGGVNILEVTFDQSGNTPEDETASMISSLRSSFPDMYIGAGTVLTPGQLRTAYKAGAQFIVSPDSCREIIAQTRSLELVSVPGAMTPTEAANAHRWGADFVKLFPNAELGPGYLKAIATPLSHIHFLAVGGITPANIRDYMNAGACGIGVSGGIVNKKLIAEGRWDDLTALAAEYLRLLHND